MRVYDIYAEASEYLGTNDQAYIFRTLGRATEYLANKGDWDVLKGYIDLPIQTVPAPPGPPQPPTAIPPGGNFPPSAFPLTITVSCPDQFPAETMMYTLDGTPPSLINGTPISSPNGTVLIPLPTTTTSVTLKIIAVFQNIISAITQEIYVASSGPPPPQLQPPTATPPGGFYSRGSYPLTVNLVCPDMLSTETMMYTLNGKDPSPTYGTPIPSFMGSVVIPLQPSPTASGIPLKVIALNQGAVSAINEQHYGVIPTVPPGPAAPEFPPAIIPPSVGGTPAMLTNIVILPWQVDTPLKFTISDIPAFSKDRLYEFTLNGFGSNPGRDRVDYSWEDRGFVPISIIPQYAPFKVAVMPDSENAGKRVFLQGTLNNIEQYETLTIDAASWAWTEKNWDKLTEVNKEITVNPVNLWVSGVLPAPDYVTGDDGLNITGDDGDWVTVDGEEFVLTPVQLIARYYPFETNPRYRMIRLSQQGVTAHFLFRRKVFKIYSMDDFIPVQSELGLLTMIQAIQALRRKDMEVAKAMADAAVEVTTDAQRATTGFIELANNTEIQAARNYVLYNRDSVIVLDVYDEVAKILGNVGQFKIFDAITKGLEVLCNKGHWDGFTGYVDITTDGRRMVTLPRFIDQPITISINGRPAWMKNKWAEFHLNGPGSDEFGGQWMGGTWQTWAGFSGSGRWGQVRSWDSVGEVVTIKPLGAVSQLVAIPDDPADDGKTITVYGFDGTGKWIRTNGQDGFVIITDHTKLVPIPTDQQVARITRINRQPTSGFVRLWAFDAATLTTSVMLGYYYPDETEPQYFRIKLPLDAHWIRLRYRKRTLKVTSVWQPLHLYSRMAIETIIRSFKTLETDAAASQVFEDKAVRYLDEDQKARNPGETFQLQFNEDTGWGSNFIVS